MSAIRRRWRFTGTVQGVGFRYYARAAALHLGLTGWVANNWDSKQPASYERVYPKHDPKGVR